VRAARRGKGRAKRMREGMGNRDLVILVAPQPGCVGKEWVLRKVPRGVLLGRLLEDSARSLAHFQLLADGHGLGAEGGGVLLRLRQARVRVGERPVLLVDDRAELAFVVN
jgi:hypothetical protein